MVFLHAAGGVMVGMKLKRLEGRRKELYSEFGFGGI